MKSRIGNRFWLLLLVIAAIGAFAYPADTEAAQAAVQSRLSAKVKLSAQAADRAISGRLFLFFSKTNPNPMNGPNWFGPEPFFATDVQQWQPGGERVVDDRADGLPGKLSKLPSGQYYVQAVLDHDFFFADHKNGVGNFFSSAKRILVRDGQNDVLELTLDQVIAAKPGVDTPLAKLISVRSQRLSDFHRREVSERALVLLPKSYLTEPDKRYPVYYEVSGFGGVLEQMAPRRKSSSAESEGVEFIHVMLTGQCKWGHHVYANSATNGPRGDALVMETIPEIDRQFRTIPKPSARFVGGHSSGGWSSLWLQVSYPEFFGGVWSTAPDPVDFRDWQGTNLLKPGANVFRTEDGKRQPLARNGGQILIWYDDFQKMDTVMGRGGQLRSFEAVFSPLDADGQPSDCWDHETGQVDPKIVKAWAKYDISRKIAENWQTLGPKLAGKLHVFTGDQDTFFLDHAVVLMKQRLESLGSDAKIEIVPGKTHFDLLDPTLRRRIYSEMASQFKSTTR